MATLRQRAVTKERRDEDTQTQFFRASPDGRTGVSSYTGEGRIISFAFLRVCVFTCLGVLTATDS